MSQSINFSEKPRQLNLKDDATHILALVHDLGEHYAASYLIELLRGGVKFGLRKESHSELNSFGRLTHRHSEQLLETIQFLQMRGYLQIADARFGTLMLTQLGNDFLECPEDLLVPPQKLRRSPFDKLLYDKLRSQRNELAEQEGKPAYTIVTNHSLQELVRLKPETVEALLMVPGFGFYKANRYGAPFLKIITELKTQLQQYREQQRLQRAHSPSHQAVKSLFEAGLSVDEIAAKRGVQAETVQRSLETLHWAGEIDLKPWIEETVPQAELDQGSEWFRASESGRLKEAYEALGLDYDILKLCRLYVADVSTRQEPLAKAS